MKDLPTTILRPVDIQERFGKTPRGALKLMRRMKHVKPHHGEIYTTEEWLAEWLMANAIEGSDWREVTECMDPLDVFVAKKFIRIMGELAKAGKIKVVTV